MWRDLAIVGTTWIVSLYILCEWDRRLDPFTLLQTGLAHTDTSTTWGFFLGCCYTVAYFVLRVVILTVILSSVFAYLNWLW